jgi:hypothetical protein
MPATISARLPFWTGTYELTYVLKELFKPDLSVEVVPDNFPFGDGFIPALVPFSLDLVGNREHMVCFNYHLDCDVDCMRVLDAVETAFTRFLLSRIVDIFGGRLQTEEGDVIRTAARLRLPRRQEGERFMYPLLDRQLERWRFSTDEVVILAGLNKLSP